MRSYIKSLLIISALLPLAAYAQNATGTPPRWNIKTNLLSDITTTMNIGAEFRVGGRTSIDIPVSWNPWEFRGGVTKWKHILVQPEFRWWLRGETFDGHFLGAHAHWAYYNIGALPHGPFSKYMHTHRFYGWLAGAGASYGYRWNFNHRWALEATVGLGYAYLSYDKFECGTCAKDLGHETKHYFGPTKLGVSLIIGIGGKRAESAPVYVAPAATAMTYQPKLTTNFIVPEVEAVKLRSESYSAYLNFEVGRWEILPDFRGNATELNRIHELMRRVSDDPDATIAGISVTGYASPEGTYSSNMTLSRNRTRALKNHINLTYGLPENLFTVRGAGEDWATLEEFIADSDIYEKNRILAIIRGTSDPDERENRLKGLQGGYTYRQIYDEYYPRLRRSDYRIDYTVAPFSVEKGKEVLRTRPGNLSLSEMFLIANTYEPGSRDSGAVFETAAQVFPDSDVANLNAASVALTRDDAAAAARYLERVKEHTATYWNNMGVLFWLQGNATQAAECFTRAGTQAAGNSAEIRKHLASIEK